ncbi:MAG: CRISPR-associated endonuclease Cas1 [Rikenellaceae bacterium]
MNYSEEDMLMLSGIQHFVFCPRQWALIHIEQQWSDNHLTTEGNILHINVDNPHYRQKNGEHITLRSLHIASKELGLYGIADAVELIPAEDELNSITHQRYSGRWLPIPVEYKRGHSKISHCDRVQLTAQVIALEDMYGVEINHGAIFYWENRRREVVPITQELRVLTQKMADEMHQKEDFIFRGRNRRPALDAVNTLLSFVYTLIANDVAAALETVGLDPYVGFLHTLRPGRTSLALDLMEGFRAYLGDRLVLSLINRRQITIRDFIYQGESGVILSDNGRKTVLSAWQNRKKEQITHPYLEERIPIGLLPYVQSMLLARCVRGELDDYPVFIIK